jgi:hypothetical protein
VERQLALEVHDPLGLLGDLFAEPFILLAQPLALLGRSAGLLQQVLTITRSALPRSLRPPPTHPGYDSGLCAICPAP